jgi:hypothetical protein
MFNISHCFFVSAGFIDIRRKIYSLKDWDKREGGNV